MRQITRPQDAAGFAALGLARLWAALQGAIDDGWRVDVYVVPRAWIRIELTCEARRSERPPFGRFVEAVTYPHVEAGTVLEVLVHCGCGQCNDGGGGIRVIPIRA